MNLSYNKFESSSSNRLFQKKHHDDLMSELFDKIITKRPIKTSNKRATNTNLPNQNLIRRPATAKKIKFNNATITTNLPKENSRSLNRLLLNSKSTNTFATLDDNHESTLPKSSLDLTIPSLAKERNKSIVETSIVKQKSKSIFGIEQNLARDRSKSIYGIEQNLARDRSKSIYGIEQNLARDRSKSIFGIEQNRSRSSFDLHEGHRIKLHTIDSVLEKQLEYALKTNDLSKLNALLKFKDISHENENQLELMIGNQSDQVHVSAERKKYIRAKFKKAFRIVVIVLKMIHLQKTAQEKMKKIDFKNIFFRVNQ